MRPKTFANHAGRVSRWGVIALGVSIPVSTALDNVLIAAILAAWAVSGRTHATADFLLKNRVLLYPVLLFGLLALGTLYGEITQREALAGLLKYADLLFIPVFAIVFREREVRSKALHAFALTIAMVVVLSYLIRFDVLPDLPFINGTALSPTVFKYKITHSLLVAFGAFLFAWLGSTTANRRMRLVWYVLALLAALNVLLLVKGATAYVTLGALIILFGAERMGRRGAACAMLGLAVFVTLLVTLPNPFQERITKIQQEVQDWRDGKSPTESLSEPSSTGLRLAWYRNTLDIIAAHPLAGVGTGGFTKAYARQVRGSGEVETHNPHNEYLNIAAQIGILGIVVLIALFWTQWLTAKHLESPMERALMRGLVLTMVIGCMVNSLLLDHTEGLFYAWLSGLLYGSLKCGLPEKSATQK